MIGPVCEEILLRKKEDILIPAEKIANVMDINPLSHAFLVLSKVKYSKIPVLDREEKIVGLIGLSEIVDQMFDLDAIDPDNLNDKTVADVMETNFVTVDESNTLEDLLHLAIDHAFLPVVGKDRHFVGIITRRELLKAVNRLVHDLEQENLIISKKDLSKTKIEVG